MIGKRGRGESQESRRAQVSMEYLVVVGIALLILIPGSYFFYKYSRNTNDQVVRSQIDSVGSQIVSQAKSVYSFGKDNRVTIDINIPAEVKNVTLYDGEELVFTYGSNSGTQEALFFTDVNLTGVYQLDGTRCITGWCAMTKWSSKDIISGTISLQIESQGNYVTLNQTN